MQTMIMRAFLSVLAVGALAACDGGTSAAPPAPAALQVVSGDGQQGTAGTMLENMLVVRVVDAQGRPLAGRTVSFAVTGGGEVRPASEVTRENGQATALWVLGTSTADSQRVEARVDAGGGGALTAVFRASARAGAPAAIAAVGETSFTGITGAPLPTPLRVRVTDSLGNPYPGGTIVWQVRVGGGTVPVTSLTDASGVAAATWTLGMLAVEPQRVEVRTLGTTVAFTAVAAPPENTVVTIEGNGQSAEVGSDFREFLWLQARLPDGRAVWRLPVEWSGDGLLRPTSETDGAGRTLNAWKATALGPLTARATVRTAGAPITVEWTGTGTAPSP